MDFSWTVSPAAYDKLKIHSLLTGFLCSLPGSPSPPSSDVSLQPSTKPTFPCWIMILLMGLPNNYFVPSNFLPSFCFCWACVVLVEYVQPLYIQSCMYSIPGQQGRENTKSSEVLRAPSPPQRARARARTSRSTAHHQCLLRRQMFPNSGFSALWLCWLPFHLQILL